jgi:hypothetical protein
MRKIAFFLLTVGIGVAVAQSDAYPVKIHVTSSRWAMEPGLTGPRAVQRLNVTIDGKKFELATPATPDSNFDAGITLLVPGDYKAKLTRDQHKTAYESSQEYKFLLPDNKTREFFVVGISE